MNGTSEPTRTVWATWRFTAWHAWPGAPDRRDYLRSRHRHVFHCRCEITVAHDDREVEFHDLLDLCVEATDSFGVNLGAMSCEHIAIGVRTHLAGEGMLHNRACQISVSEDGENGATLAWEPELW